MELAMLCRDSDDRLGVLESYGFEWTVGFGHALLFVAFPGSVRQQVLELGDTPRRNVACLLASVIDCGVLARIR